VELIEVEKKGFGNTFINKDIVDKYKPKEIFEAGWNACCDHLIKKFKGGI